MSHAPRERHLLLHLTGLAVGALILLPLAYLAVQAWALRDVERATRALWAPESRAALRAGLELAGVVAAVSLAVAVPLAWLTHATDLPGRRFFRIALNLPLAVPSYVSAFMVVALFGPRGWLQQALGATFGVERLPDVYGFPGAAMALVFVYPYALIPLQAALARTDPRLWEASRSLGHGPWRTFVAVILPSLRAPLAGGALLICLYVLSDFGAVSLLRYESLSYLVYVRHKSLFDKQEAVFLAVLLALVALGAIALQRLVAGRGARAAAHGGSARPWPVVRLGRWRWPAFALCALVVGYGVVLPVATVMVWLVRGLLHGNEAIGHLGRESLTTLWLGALAGVVTVAVAVAPALLGRFGRRGVWRVVHAASHAGYALPGIVVALSLVFFAVRVAEPFYQTTSLLVFAYVVRFLPLAVGTLGEGLAAQSPRIYEAARGLGRTPLAAWYQVVLPMSVPALWAGFLAVMLSVVRELPATLLLSPLDFATLATRIWALTEEAFFTAAAPPVLILLLIAAGALLVRPDAEQRRR